MHQALHARFQFHKRPVRHQIDHLALDLRADLILGIDVFPWIAQLLFQSQAHPLLFPVDVQHHHVDVLPDLEQFRGMPDAPPAHVGDMEQSIDAVEVNEGAEISDILDCSLADVARGHVREQLAPLFIALLFDQLAPGQNDVLALLVDFDDFKFVAVADELGQVLGRDHIDLRGRQKGLHPDVDEQTAFDRGFDLAGDGAPFIANGQDFVPILFEFGLLLGKDDHAFLVFQLFDQDIDFIAELDGFNIVEFGAGNDAFTFVTDIDEDFFGADFNDSTFDNLARGKAGWALLEGFFHRKHNYYVFINCGRLAGARWRHRRLHCLT